MFDILKYPFILLHPFLIKGFPLLLFKTHGADHRALKCFLCISSSEVGSVPGTGLTATLSLTRL